MLKYTYMNLLKKITQIFKHTFISHPGNDHKPHILREVTLISVVILSIFFLGVSFGRYYFLHKTVLGQNVVSSVLIDLTNETRQSYGESTLIRNDKLEKASLLKAEDMATNQYFSHNSPSGVTPWHWFKKVDYNFLYAGENLAIDFTESGDVEDAWMKSPTHKANILNGKFTEIGISTKEGVIDGHNTVYVVQMFGTPKSSNITNSNIKEVNIEKTPTKTPQEVNKIKNNNNLTVEESSTEDNLSTLVSDNNFVAVSNVEDNIDNRVLGESTSSIPVHYSNFWEKSIYKFWYALNDLYKAISILIIISIIALFFVEVKKHHWKHILYGLLTIIFLLVMLYLNSNLW